MVAITWKSKRAFDEVEEINNQRSLQYNNIAVTKITQNFILDSGFRLWNIKLK